MTLARHVLASLLVTFSAAAVGCAADPLDGDDEVASSSEDALTGGVVEGTPEAAAVLRVANEKTATELRVNVGLGDKPVTNMLAYRLGPDMTAGTADDRAFATLAELDRITWVNSREFRLMLAWAKANGWVAEAPAPSDLGCVGADLAARDVLPLFAPGATEAGLGAYVVEGRTRTCTGPTGCTPWADDASPVKPAMRAGKTTAQVVDASGAVAVSFHPLRGDAWLSGAPLGRALDAGALAATLVDPTGYVFDGNGALKRECGALRGTKREALDGVRTQETEVVLRAVHAPSGGVSSAFATPRTMTFTCNSHHWGYAYTCQGRSEYDREGTGTATVQIAPDGSSFTFEGVDGLADYSSDFDGTYAFDAHGRAGKTFDPQASYARALTVQRTSSALAVSLGYAWTSSANWCGASTHFSFECVGVLDAN